MIRLVAVLEVHEPPLAVILRVIEPAAMSAGEGEYTVPKVVVLEKVPVPLVDHKYVVNCVATAWIGNELCVEQIVTLLVVIVHCACVITGKNKSALNRKSKNFLIVVYCLV